MKMYAVIHENYVKSASVRLMGTTIKQAVELWEEYNHGVKFSEAKGRGWKIVKHNVEIME